MNFQAALSLLALSADTCEENAKINLEEGDTEQAELNAANAVEYREAMAVLNHQNRLSMS